MSGLIFNNLTLPKPLLDERISEISWTCWIIAYFVSNFVAMTTGVSRCRIFCRHSMTPDSQNCYVQGFWLYFLHKFSYSLFCFKFCCRGNRGWSWWNLSDIIQLLDPENPLIGARISAISLIQAELQSILFQISLPFQIRCHGNRGRFWWNLSDVIQ